MRLKSGEKVKNIKLMDIARTEFDLDSFSGKPYMLSFYRFASCPFCNLRVNSLVQRFDEFGEDFTTVAIFNADLEQLTRHTEKHQASFPILADPHGKYYRKYGIENSVLGFFTGMIMRLPTLLKGMFIKGYLPNLFTGGLTIMPADFLVDREGIIQEAYYGKDEGDHLDFETIKRFSLIAVSE
ncbi:MAG: AhpC/TSA family protein [FCB group bacterium]|nr:AhpC/TSA family protein [FCB group bacterium]MBL7027184.1 AhpC/TSA family protein [Candidatus Neomarinimicrobiota bacterium]MBL7120581.1 AhpC/TSA family protein [Candidatus Neomarinimicrobiota bacterium]